LLSVSLSPCCRYHPAGVGQPSMPAFHCPCCLRPTVAGSASGVSHFRGHLCVHFRYGLVDSLTKTITTHSNRLHAVLQRYYPQALGVFSDLQTQICLQFLIAYPAPNAAQALTYGQFTDFCRSQRYPDPKRLPELYAHLRRPTLKPNPTIVLAYQDETVTLARMLLYSVQRKGQCIIRAMPTSESDGCRPSVPGYADHLFRRHGVHFFGETGISGRHAPESLGAYLIE